MNFSTFDIVSPKRTRTAPQGWQGFFPYYAGYPVAFAERIIASAGLAPDAVVLDPWNGSGTTTFAALEAGFASIGIDLNPTMVVVARARSLAASEADALIPLAEAILDAANSTPVTIAEDDELLLWCDPETATAVRSIETAVRKSLVGGHTLPPEGPNLEMLSGLAATQYVALFRVLRLLSRVFATTNPTWIKKPRSSGERLSCDNNVLHTLFLDAVGEMAEALFARRSLIGVPPKPMRLLNRDSTEGVLDFESVDFVLTSPPYCTRIDYVSATRIELAVLQPLRLISQRSLQRSMVGSILAPRGALEPKDDWGQTCCSFLERVKAHPSKASSTYYYNTHLDYFSKLFSSLASIAKTLKKTGRAVFVVQDSFYKDLHNDLSAITAEMCAASGLSLERRDNFPIARTMAGRHRHVKKYRSNATAVESVLCFQNS